MRTGEDERRLIVAWLRRHTHQKLLAKMVEDGVHTMSLRDLEVYGKSRGLSLAQLRLDKKG